MPWWPMAMAVGHGDGCRTRAAYPPALVDAGAWRTAPGASARMLQGGGLVPARHHAHERAMDLLLFEAHGIVVGSDGARASAPSVTCRLGSFDLSNVLASMPKSHFLTRRMPYGRTARPTRNEVLGASSRRPIAPCNKVSSRAAPPGRSRAISLVLRMPKNCRPFVAQ